MIVAAEAPWSDDRARSHTTSVPALSNLTRRRVQNGFTTTITTITSISNVGTSFIAR